MNGGQLNIGGADIGFDANEVQRALNDIHAHVIETTENALRFNLTNLDAAVDEVWSGKSAETFKSNMHFDVEAICKALDEAYEGLKIQFAQMTNAMNEFDANLIQERSE